MFGREKRFRRPAPGDTQYRDGGAVATAERPVGPDGNGTAVATREPATAAPVALDDDARLRQRDRFGGLNWGAAFFGWLVAIGMGVILTAIVAAAGAALGLTRGASTTDAAQNADTVGIVGGALLIAIALAAYFCGGYVAGRMSRFDGARQGFGVWAFGLVMTLVIAAAGWIFGDQYNVFQDLKLPRIPLKPSELTTGGVITLAAIALGSLVAAVVGGKAGQRYHRRVDRAALLD